MTELMSGQFILLAETVGLSGYACFTLNNGEHILIYSMDNLHDCSDTVFHREWERCWLYQDIMTLYPDTTLEVLYDYMRECLVGFTVGMLRKNQFDCDNQ